MHYGHRRVVVSEQVAALRKLLNLIAHFLKQGAPRHAAGAPHPCDGAGQPLFVHRPAHPLPQEMGRKEVLDPQAGDYGLLKAAELPRQERCRFAGCHIAAGFEQVQYATRGQFPNRSGVLRPGDLDFCFIVRRGQ